jgi:uncharacterized protein YgbK (DUF1537 family)
MTDSNLVRLLAAQATQRVGLVGIEDLEAGETAVREKLAVLRRDGCAHAVVDATRDEHLATAGSAFRDLALTTGGAGLGVGLARALRPAGAGTTLPWSGPGPAARVAWLAGSCSVATRAQVAAARAQAASIRIDPLALHAEPGRAAGIAAEAVRRLGAQPVLVYATAEPHEVAAVQSALGVERAATLIEDCFRRVAAATFAAGVRAFVVAGGETAGAVVDALGVAALAIGPEIDPGVPWTRSVGTDPVWLALKSGNFGGADFFQRATEML